MEFLDDGTLVSCDTKGSTKLWEVSSGQCKDVVHGEQFTFSKAAGSEQRTGRFLIMTEGDLVALVLVHQTDCGEASDTKQVPVAFFRAPSPVRTVACAGEHIGIGCESGAVIHLRAPWLVES